KPRPRQTRSGFRDRLAGVEERARHDGRAHTAMLAVDEDAGAKARRGAVRPGKADHPADPRRMHDDCRLADNLAIEENRLAAERGGFSMREIFIEGEAHQRPTDALARYLPERSLSDEVSRFGQVDQTLEADMIGRRVERNIGPHRDDPGLDAA